MMNNYKPKYVVGKSFEKLGRYLEPGNQGNTMGPWDNKTYEVEDSAFGFVVMENGAVIYLEASWALNSLDVGEAKTTLCGTKAGADMNSDIPGQTGLRINTVVADKLAVIKPDVGTPRGVDYFPGASLPPQDMETKLWLDAIEAGDQNVLYVQPEQAFIVTKILDAIYQSSAKGQMITF
jgi:predicted dehydrogenase